MNKFCVRLLGIAFVTLSVAVYAQTPVPVQGAVVGLAGNTLEVKTREGRDMKVELSKDATISYSKAVQLSDIKPGTPLGVTAEEGPGGKLVASAIHVFPADRAVPNEGHRPMAAPGSTMTNARVSAVAQMNGSRELTLTYKGGSNIVTVPDKTPVLTTVPADRSALVPGANVSTTATMDNDGKLSATRVQVSKTDGA